VQKHLPEFPISRHHRRQLMNHTSGVTEYFDLCIRYTGALDTIDNQAIMQLFADVKPPLDFAPGEKWQYSNTGYVVLGSLIEKLSGKSMADYFTEKITRPLGLKNTYIYHLKMKSSPENRVYGFRREDGKNKLDDLMRFDGLVGDGNVYSSAEDLLKWTQALHGGKVLKQATLRRNDEARPAERRHHLSLWLRSLASIAGNCAAHTGGWVGFLNLLWTDFEKKRTLVVLSSGGSAAGLQAGWDAVYERRKNHLAPKRNSLTTCNWWTVSGSPARRTSVRL
jgi:N-acyl-D-amino-acid deacylase